MRALSQMAAGDRRKHDKVLIIVPSSVVLRRVLGITSVLLGMQPGRRPRCVSWPLTLLHEPRFTFEF